jgi:hypothetical protein
MSKPRLLCDECIDPDLIAALRQLDPSIDIIRVGDAGTPPRGTLDPDLLLAAEAMGRVLITNDRNTMPGHLISHFAAGHHTAGVILLRRGFSIGKKAQAIHSEWVKTTADDWIDGTIYLP